MLAELGHRSLPRLRTRPVSGRSGAEEVADRAIFLAGSGINRFVEIGCRSWPEDKPFSREGLSHPDGCRLDRRPRRRTLTGRGVDLRPGFEDRSDVAGSAKRANKLHRPVPAVAAQGQRAALDDPDLATVVDAWDRLPEAVRAGI